MFNEAIVRYKNYKIPFDKDSFLKQCYITGQEEYWAGFDKKTGRMIGYTIFDVYSDWVNFRFSKYSACYLKLRVSDAINATVLDYYLNTLQKKYISDGERSILHKTNVQEYLIDHFGYRRAYCKLHIRYRRMIKVLVKALMPVRRVLQLGDGMTVIHQINSLLFMDLIVNQKS